MQKKRILEIVACLIAAFAVMIGILVYRNASSQNTPKEIILEIEDTLNDEYKKQSVTRLVATLTYGNNDNGNKIYYHILKTDYYEKNPLEITGLNTVAFGVLFPVEFMDSCEQMKIQEWPAALYKKGKSAYLCWTYSPEISYALEYNTTEIQDLEIIKMAESAKEGS